MSMVLAVHTKDFGVIASDGRALDEQTKAITGDTRCKFQSLWGNLVIAGTGSEEFTQRVFREASAIALTLPWEGGGEGFQLVSRLARDRIREHQRAGGYPSALLLVGEDATGTIRGSAWNTEGVEDEAIRGGVVAQAFGTIDSETYQRAINRLGVEVEALVERGILTPARLILGMQRVYDAVAEGCPKVNNLAFFHVIRPRSRNQIQNPQGASVVDGVAYNVRCHAENAAGAKSTYATVTNHTVSGAPLVSSNASYRPLTNPLTATDAGASATVNIAAFTMRISGTDLSINSGSITGLSFETVYFIYYEDWEFDGGTVTYAATTVRENALNGPARFFVGSIQTPADGAPDTVGNPDGGAGAQYAIVSVRRPTDHVTVGMVSVPTYAYDENPSSGAILTGISGAYAGLYLRSIPAQVFLATKVVLRSFLYFGPETSGSARGRLLYSFNGGSTWQAAIFDETVTVGQWKYNAVELPVGTDLTQVWVNFTVFYITDNAMGLWYDCRIEAMA